MRGGTTGGRGMVSTWTVITSGAAEIAIVLFDRIGAIVLFPETFTGAIDEGC